MLQHNLIYENPHDPHKQHCSTCISRSETQTTKLAAGQFILNLVIFNRIAFLTFIIIYGQHCMGFNFVNSSP